MAEIRVVVAGAGGRMGVANIAAVAAHPDLVLHAAIDRPGGPAIGRDAGTYAGLETLGVSITDDLAAAIEEIASLSDELTQQHD